MCGCRSVGFLSIRGPFVSEASIERPRSRIMARLWGPLGCKSMAQSVHSAQGKSTKRDKSGCRERSSDAVFQRMGTAQEDKIKNETVMHSEYAILALHAGAGLAFPTLVRDTASRMRYSTERAAWDAGPLQPQHAAPARREEFQIQFAAIIRRWFSPLMTKSPMIGARLSIIGGACRPFACRLQRTRDAFQSLQRLLRQSAFRFRDGLPLLA